MSYGFDNITEKERTYLKQAGLHTNAKFLGLTYNATEAYEYFDIEIEAADGRYFRERTFGPDITKVYPKAIYEKGQKVGMETKEQAFERVQNEISTKLYNLAVCFESRDAVKDKIAIVGTLKELVEAVGKLIDPTVTTINFLTIWKNSDTREKSNLIIAERIKWCEPFKADSQATIRLTPWQLANQTVEKYPYKGENSEAEGSDGALVNSGIPADHAGDDLPF